MTDPIVAEVRRHRTEHTRRFNGELSRICQLLREIQKGCGHKVVRLPPKRLRPTGGAVGEQRS